MNENKTMSVGDWIITMIVTAIPLVGFIMLFVWAFSSGTNLSKKNWAKAALIFYAIIMVLYFLFFASMIAAMASAY
ncbi:dolichyl-diphosphooligosaccharide--protein glycosyltransferase subunit 2 [Polaribacter sp.]|jgi:hypothetical protein|nr:dolichyl-diphosphooligosaccharide--protein glycosyltransferase subunit 2 [Polaribacter sp.]|tara:strand:+ start:564 stop:791 length:228 start_codon:yes stop_codon:yes gene_type:complete